MHQYDLVTITVNYKSKDSIANMLVSLFDDLQSTNLKIKHVVIDNDSKDEIVETYGSKFQNVDFIVNNKNVGFGGANNIAFSKYKARYYWINNPDIVFPSQKSILKRLYDFMENNPKIGIVAPKLVLSNNEVQPSCMRFSKFIDHPLHRLNWHKKYKWAGTRINRLLMTDFNHRRTAPVDWVTGAAIMFRGEALEEVGGFDDSYFMYFEDCDLCRRFWVKGWPVYYKGDTELLHGHARDSAKTKGVLKSVFQNKLTREHLISFVRYWVKWKSHSNF